MKITLTIQTYLLSALYLITYSLSLRFERSNFLATEEKTEYYYTPRDKTYRIKSYLISDIDNINDPIKNVQTQLSLTDENIVVINSRAMSKNITYCE
jgi:hypothetical protein